MRHLFFLPAILLISSCVSTKSADMYAVHSIEGPKTITIMGDRAPWTYEIEKRLKKSGFTVKRMASQKRVTDKVSGSRVESYNSASARYALYIDAYAPTNMTNRCFGGGFRFDYINVELIDAKLNETLFHYSNSGYSEGCPPMSGTIFSDIVSMTEKAWK